MTTDRTLGISPALQVAHRRELFQLDLRPWNPGQRQSKNYPSFEGALETVGTRQGTDILEAYCSQD